MTVGVLVDMLSGRGMVQLVMSSEYTDNKHCSVRVAEVYSESKATPVMPSLLLICMPFNFLE